MERIKRSESEWKNVLTAEQYEVMRNKGTERPFTGNLLKNIKKGTYVCAACGSPLFSSEDKFDSGTGWPSFSDVAKKGNVEEKTDNKFLVKRTEVVCSRCGGHLGHVFDDGPRPTGLRYCINSVSLGFKKDK